MSTLNQMHSCKNKYPYLAETLKMKTWMWICIWKCIRNYVEKIGNKNYKVMWILK